MQADEFNCSVFSVQNLNTMNKLGIQGLESSFPAYSLRKDYLDTKPNKIDDIHPLFFKSSQNSTVIKESLSKKPENKNIEI